MRSSDTVRNIVQTDNKRKGGEKAKQLVEPQTNVWKLKPIHSQMICLPIALNKAITNGERLPLFPFHLFSFFCQYHDPKLKK